MVFWARLDNGTMSRYYYFSESCYYVATHAIFTAVVMIIGVGLEHATLPSSSDDVDVLWCIVWASYFIITNIKRRYI